jgi:RHS repeat-associated protein
MVIDESGNLIDDGERSYAWDGANRLAEVTDKRTGQREAFQYDGQSRLTVKRTYANAAQPVETRYLWCGDAICQKRDANDAIQATYYAEGEQQGNTALYYVKDHLGSVTDVIDAQGKRLGELDYGPYGETVKTTGQVTDYRYAGMFHLPETGLYLTHYRLYDPNAGRWLNRDPIGETGGLNLYGYVGENPVNRVDLLGLSEQDIIRIRHIIQHTINIMSENRERIPNPWRNNQCKRYPFTCPEGYDSDNIKDCGEQTSAVNIALEKGKYDENWQFYMDSGFGHAWGLAISSNEDDPLIYYDPRANEVSVGKPCPSCNGWLNSGRYYDSNPLTRPFPPPSGN